MHHYFLYFNPSWQNESEYICFIICWFPDSSRPSSCCHHCDYWARRLQPLVFVFILLSNKQSLTICVFASEGSLSLHKADKGGGGLNHFITSRLTQCFLLYPPLSSTTVWFTMTTESDADSEAKQPQEKKETGKGKAKAAAKPTSPQNHPEQLPAAAGHSTPARKEQVSLVVTHLRYIPQSLYFFSPLYRVDVFRFKKTFLSVIPSSEWIVSLS